MAYNARTIAQEELETVVIQEFKKLMFVDLEISKRAIKSIASFVLTATLDLIARADKNRLHRFSDEISSGEESYLSDEPGTVEDAIQAYRDLEDYYVLTSADDEELFFRLSRHNERIQRGRARFLLSQFSNPKEWDDSTKVLISLYIELLTKELLEESIALIDGRSSQIEKDDVIDAVRIRERGH